MLLSVLPLYSLFSWNALEFFILKSQNEARKKTFASATCRWRGARAIARWFTHSHGRRASAFEPRRVGSFCKLVAGRVIPAACLEPGPTGVLATAPRLGRHVSLESVERRDPNSDVARRLAYSWP
ncbi:hypothetical protein MTO96_008601 [Rhipicephalus appendiculatus]